MKIKDITESQAISEVTVNYNHLKNMWVLRKDAVNGKFFTSSGETQRIIIQNAVPVIDQEAADQGKRVFAFIQGDKVDTVPEGYTERAIRFKPDEHEPFFHTDDNSAFTNADYVKFNEKGAFALYKEDVTTESQSLSESTFPLDEQVDWIYNSYFAEFVKKINANKVDSLSVPNEIIDTTMIPRNETIDKANEINKCDIAIGYAKYGNQYIPGRKLISVSFNHNAYNFVIDQGGIEQAVNAIGSRGKALRNEFSEHRIKGSIYHELSHWLDDTFHNSHISNKLNRASQAGASEGDKILQQGQPDVALTNFERDAQIHSIKQMKRDEGDMWDLLSFEEMVRMNPSLEMIYDEGKKQGWFDKWKKMILRRMNREGLVGDEMR